MFRAGLLTALFAGTATAAIAGSPEPAPMPEPAPVAPPIEDWSGAFIGVQAGGAQGDVDWLFPLAGTRADHDNDGGFGGLYAGYNWQSNSLVYGFDAEFNASDISGSTPCPNPAFSCQTELNSFGSIRGRIGGAMDRWHIYGAAGYAFADADAQSINVATGAPFYAADTSETLDGWTIAFGAERKLGSNTVLRGEIAHYEFDTANYFQPSVAPGNIGFYHTALNIGLHLKF